MADKIRWYIDGVISRTKTEVGGVFRLEDDIEPEEVFMHSRIAGTGTVGTQVDILADGVSIFDQKPTMNPNDTEKVWTTIPLNTIRAGSVLRLDITGIHDVGQCRDLTVELSYS